MADRSFLSWPLFEERHRELAGELEQWCRKIIHDAEAGEGGYR